jgi:hypothetical protein
LYVQKLMVQDVSEVDKNLTANSLALGGGDDIYMYIFAYLPCPNHTIETEAMPEVLVTSCALTTCNFPNIGHNTPAPQNAQRPGDY